MPTSVVHTLRSPSCDLQTPFEAAVVIPTLLRPSLARAVQSIYRQQFAGRIQIMLGVDKPLGDPQVLTELDKDRPAHCVVTVIDLGYSTSTRHGGVHSEQDGGVLRTLLSYAANSRYVAYLDDDNWLAENHLASLRQAMEGHDWAYSLRWFVDHQTLQPLCIDEWESVGLDAGVYREKFGGWVDPNCLMIDKLNCEPVLRSWSIPLPGDRTLLTGDRHVFAHLRDDFRSRATGLATAYYVLNHKDVQHAPRLARIAAKQALERVRSPVLETQPISSSNLKDISKQFAEARTLHQSGKLEQAEPIYRQVLRANPQHVDTLNLLGVLLSQLGKNDQAVDFLTQAIHRKPDWAEPHNNLSVVFKALGMADEAVNAGRQAVRINPRYHEAYSNLGNALQLQGKGQEAVDSYRQALQIKPDYASAHFNLGNALRRLGDLPGAADSYRQAIRCQPNLAQAHANLGIVLQEQGSLPEAVASCRRALQINPHQPESRICLGNILKEQGKLEEAADCYQELLRFKPDYFEAQSNRGVVLKDLGRLEESVACFHQALRLCPEATDVHNNLGNALKERGLLEESLSCFQQALRLKPDSIDAHWNRSLAWLLLGDYEKGWPEYEWRRQLKGFPIRSFPQPAWNGAHLAGRTILLHAEQGVGDTLQFIRYAPLVKERGGTVLFQCPPLLVRTLASCPGIDRLIPEGEEVPPFDVQTPLLSLPAIFQTTLATVPQHVPYLFPEADLVDRWRQKLEDCRGFKIGLVWQGNPRYRSDRHRSIPLIQFAPLGRLPGVELFSLQKGSASEQVPEVSDQFRIVDLADQLDDFAQTAAVMKNLDLVITVDTAVAHLAGALGVPVWVLLRFAPDWRWLMHRPDSPWYPTMRLFRQEKRGDWQPVLQSVIEAVKLQQAATK